MNAKALGGLRISAHWSNKRAEKQDAVLCAKRSDCLMGLVTVFAAWTVRGRALAKGMTKISYRGYRFPSEVIQQASGSAFGLLESLSSHAAIYNT